MHVQLNEPLSAFDTVCPFKEALRVLCWAPWNGACLRISSCLPRLLAQQLTGLTSYRAWPVACSHRHHCCMSTALPRWPRFSPLVASHHKTLLCASLPTLSPPPPLHWLGAEKRSVEVRKMRSTKKNASVSLPWPKRTTRKTAALPSALTPRRPCPPSTLRPRKPRSPFPMAARRPFDAR